MRSEIVKRILKCPVCSACLEVTENQRSAVCLGARKHCFDFSAQGYLSLSGGGGDSKEAVAARHSFLWEGYYEAAARAVCDAVKKYLPNDSVIIDAGCGEGYYTSKLAMLSGVTVGVDLSKHGCAAAAKQAKRDAINNVLYATASVFELPFEKARKVA